MDFKVDINGMENLQKTLKKLPVSAQKKAWKRSLAKGARVVRKAAADNVKAITSESEVSTGTLARSLGVFSMKPYKGMLRYGIRIRPKSVHPTAVDKSGKPVRVGLYGAVLEYGKENQPPRSWLRKAARDKTGEVLEAVRSEAFIRLPEAIEDAKK